MDALLNQIQAPELGCIRFADIEDVNHADIEPIMPRGFRDLA